MAMPKRFLCKFFAHGACLKGEHCEFSHDWKNRSNNVCVYYQKGCCAYGSRCRYEHTKASRSQSIGSSSSSPSPANPSKPCSSGTALISGTPTELCASSRPFLPPSQPVWKRKSVHHDVLDGDDVVDSRITGPADHSMCSFAAAGDCPYGDKCPHIHGDLCPTCGKRCLHPFRPEEREEHLKMCDRKQKQLEALKCSQEIECCVCLERVLSKSLAAERKFGILSECDHPFCISCIRNWRSSSPSSGMDVNNTLKACPICRKVSYFVIPSVIWYNTKEEKQEIMDSYKANLKLIDCKHFNFGNGNCPFGTSCFYKHTIEPGSYTWKYQRPPPRRPPRRRPPPQRNDILDMLDIINAMEELGELEYETPDDEFLANCEPWQMEFFVDQLGYCDDSIFSSSDDEINF